VPFNRLESRKKLFIVVLLFLKSERDVILRNVEPDFHVETTPLTGLDENESGRRESTDLVSTSKNFFAADAREKSTCPSLASLCSLSLMFAAKLLTTSKLRLAF
jgi:hypothetical protein